MMVVLTISALSFSVLARSHEQEEEARAAYSYTRTRVENARNANQRIIEQTKQIKNNSRMAAQVAQDQLFLLRRNEIVVAVR
ncbi:MAG TPA: hypothetical protein VJ302_14030 [Blastocatellia bacterium]|nr:hypothetical protein [Blastocatellia bacterium]